MNPIVTFGIAGALALAGAVAAFAQSSQPPSTRAEVRAEAARALEESFKLRAGGEAFGPYGLPQGKSTRTREERDAETLAARRDGELAPAGDAGDVRAERAAMSGPSTRTRAERKGETRTAEKARELTPAGEGQDAPRR